LGVELALPMVAHHHARMLLRKTLTLRPLRRPHWRCPDTAGTPQAAVGHVRPRREIKKLNHQKAQPP
ncbi:MAG: hypothetical protein KDA66_03360, partial [Planctomycetaceae bacterium]|nr:hypothetical protein [Planctomycetaceae bacterium]